VSRAENVVLNALFLDPGVSGGPETYLRGLAPALRAVREDGGLTVVTTRRGAAALRDGGWPGEGIGVYELPCDDGERARRQIAEQIVLGRVSRHLDADVLHSLASIAPIRVAGVAHVITVHDVNFIHHSTFGGITTWGMRQVIPRAARRADALIADAAASRDDICATLGLSPQRFTVVPLGAGLGERPDPTPEAEIRGRYSLGQGRVVLCVGAKRPHKNQAILLRALPELPPDLRLVLAGHAESYEEELRREAAELRIADRVRFPGWVSAQDLEGLWRVASVAAFSTLAEGFGLPLLEAMSRGVPTAASDLPVLREVGDAWPRYFDPLDPADVTRAILSLLEDPPDPAAGRARAAVFSWEAAARATWAVYDRVAGSPRANNHRPSR
jgi:glycosyltransferase involved in cell wall biosynthesis